MKFQQLMKTKMLENKDCTSFQTLFKTYVVFIMLINVKMPTVVGILTFMSMINLKQEKSF